MLDLLKDLWGFMRERKKLWLAPIIVIMLLLGSLMFEKLLQTSVQERLMAANLSVHHKQG